MAQGNRALLAIVLTILEALWFQVWESKVLVI